MRTRQRSNPGQTDRHAADEHVEEEQAAAEQHQHGHTSWLLVAGGRSCRKVFVFEQLVELVLARRISITLPVVRSPRRIAARLSSSASLVSRSRNSAEYGTLTRCESAPVPRPGLSIRK